MKLSKKVLRQTGEPTTPKLVIGMEEPQDEGAEDSEEPVAQWPSGPAAVEIPSLLVDPEEEDLSLEDPEAEEEWCRRTGRNAARQAGANAA